MHIAKVLESTNDEGFEKNQRHLLRQTTLVQFQIRPDHDHGTTGVIHTFTKQVLTETATLTLEHVAQRFKGTVAGTCHRAAMSAIVEQRINRLLQHALFVSNYHFRRLESQEILQTVIPVDHPTIKIVQVGCANLLTARLGHCLLQLVNASLQVDQRSRIVYGLGAHLGHERFRAVRVTGLAEFHFGEQLVFFQRRVTGINHEIIFVVDDAFEITGGHVQHQTDTGWHAFEKPDVRDRHSQLDVAHTLTAHTRLGYLHTATVTNHATMFDPFVLAAGTFPVLHRTKDTFAEQAAFLRLERTIVDRLRILDFTLGPRPNRLRRCHRDGDVIHVVDLIKSEQIA